MCIFLILTPTEDFEETIDVPADTVEIDEDSRLLILKKINLCESKGQLLDTLAVGKCFKFRTTEYVNL